MAANYWNMPLPAGYEAKYDPSSQRYFYINHNTKQTTWEDPRQSVWQQQQQTGYNSAYYQQAAASRSMPAYAAQPATAATSGYSQQAATSLNVARDGNSGRVSPRRSPQPSPRQTKSQSYELKNMTPDNKAAWRNEVESKYGISTVAAVEDDSEEELDLENLVTNNRNETSFLKVVDENKLRKVSEMFPSVDTDVIKKLLSEEGNSIAKVEAKLRIRGYKQVNAVDNQIAQKLKQDFPAAEIDLIKEFLVGAQNNEATARRNLKECGYKEQSKSSLRDGGSRSPRSVSPKPSSATVQAARNSRTAAQKLEIKAQISRLYPNSAMQVIEMVLESCDYDVQKAKALMTSVVTDDRPRQSESAMSG